MSLRPAMLLVVFIAFGVLNACAPRPRVERPEAAGPPPQFPAEMYQRAARAGERVYRVDAEASQIIGYVHADGPLAGFGHDHVISTRQVHGYVLPSGQSDGRADFYVAVTDLVVDDPRLRATAGFASELSREQIEGTRRNMLNKVLEAEQFPHVLLHLEPLPRRGTGQPLTGVLTLHGQSERVEIPARVSGTGKSVRAVGTFRITHRRFGMIPYSAFGGALRVSDEMEFRFDVLARPLEPSNGPPSTRRKAGATSAR